jgi:hypothetical protein
MGIPEFLPGTGTGKRQVSPADFFPLLRICIFQAVILGVSAMSQGAISTKYRSLYSTPICLCIMPVQYQGGPLFDRRQFHPPAQSVGVPGSAWCKHHPGH